MTRLLSMSLIWTGLLSLGAACSDDSPAAYDPSSDTAGPSVRFVSPTEGERVSGQIQVQIDAKDPGGVDQVTLTAAGETFEALREAPFEWTWDASALPDGPVSLVAVAIDGQGNETREEIGVELGPPCNDDGDCPPTATLITPEDGDVVTGEVPLNVEFNDDLGVASAALSLADGQVLLEGATSPLTGVWDSDGVNEGPTTLRLVVTDTVGQSVEVSAAITVDRTDPTLTITQPIEGALVGDALEASADADDNVGLASVRFGVLGSGASATAQAAPWEVTLDMSALDSGPHTLLVTATDLAGLSLQRAVGVILDRAPEVDFIDIADGETVRRQRVLSVTASDDLGVEALEFFVDGRRVDDFDENGEVLWTPPADADTALIEARATDTAGQTTAATLSVLLDVDPCDLDADGAQADSEACGGLDCDDANPLVNPDAEDRVTEDAIDDNCDGVDGVDDDRDTFASAESGGRDCDDDDALVFPCPFDPPGLCTDRQSDRRHCGACNEACDVGLACVESACECTDPECLPGDPALYNFNIPATFINSLSVETNPDIGRDLDNDGDPDNGFGPLMGSLVQTLGGNINNELRFQIQIGALSLGLGWRGVDTLPNSDEVEADFFTLTDADGDLATQTQYLVSSESFLPGYVTPRSRFRDGTVTNGNVVAGPAEQLALQLPLSDARLNALIEDVYLEGRISSDANGIRLSGGTLAGVLTLESLVDTLNDYLTSEDCSCLELDGPLIDLRVGEGPDACVGEFSTANCQEQGVCSAIATICSIFMRLIVTSLDLDLDEDGTNDAFGVYLRLSGNGAQLIGID